MKILTLGLGAFGFAVNKLLGENNPDRIFYGFELNKKIVTSLKKTRKHPFFFEGYKLPENIEILDSYDDIISDIDLLIIAIPAQFISASIDGFKNKLKPRVTIMNLAKGIDVKTNSPISKVFAEKLVGVDYNYSVLSGGMIAQEVVEGKMLGADLGIENLEIGNNIKLLLENKNMKIKIQPDILNIELYGSLKNIMAIMVGYYEGKGDEKSSIGFHLVNFYDEMKELIKKYDGNPEIDFSYYSLGGDIIATCFGDSRNRYFGQLLGSGKNISEVLEQLELEKKHAEGYETLKAVYEMIKDEEGFEITKHMYSLIK
ncbi:MAG: hypothetical protein QM490_02380 [Candidatus Gracilibacteria bacterium]